ncbi:MAG: MmgE/PrpD family protein [Chloroflexi bacterium]|nr:MmgE/PrpD family protein [Chloroflexota bacterium]
MDASFAFAHNVANIGFEDIPADVVKIAKLDILDTLGCALAATTLAPGCREVADLVKEGGGKEESTIIGYGGKVPSWMAALANGTLAHGLEYDECHLTAQVHSGVTSVPASFAVAERVGKVSGKTFLTAVIMGIDVAARLAVGGRVRGFHPTTVYGFFGAAAAASKILGLDEQRVQHALGIAYSQAAGNTQAQIDASLMKRVQAGFAAKGGVLSALLAQKGITGAVNSLEGEFGLYNVYNGGKYNAAALTADLGKKFEVSNLSFKPYPSPRGTHASIDATLELVRENDIKPDDVVSITVFKSAIGVKVLGSPIEKKRRPENVVEAQFNIPYTVATAVVKRRVGLKDFLPEAIKDPAVLQIADRVSVQLYPEFPEQNYHPGITEIKTRIGKVYRKLVKEPYGNPDHPIPEHQMIEKFMECASNAIKPLPEQNLKKAVAMIMKLEELDDAGDIIRLLA